MIKSNQIEKTCKMCGKNFKVYPSREKRGNCNFCSVSCSTTYRNINNNPSKNEEAKIKIGKSSSERNKGKGNPMYGKKGVFAPSYIDGRSIGQYNLSRAPYRKVLYERGNTCEVCGKKDLKEYNLHIHHKDKDHSNNNTNNLVVCCSKCHTLHFHPENHMRERDDKGRFKKKE